jgi:hypothetical protein
MQGAYFQPAQHQADAVLADLKARRIGLPHARDPHVVARTG